MNGKTQSAEWLAFLDGIATEGKLVQASFSAPRRKDEETAKKLTVRPIKLKTGVFYQFERQLANKVFHENVPVERLKEQLQSTMEQYKQALFKTEDADVQILANKKGELALISRGKSVKRAAVPQEHNRNKAYVLPEGEPVPFLVSLGVMTEEGRVVKAKYDKFRQINRFLEMVSDVISDLPRGKPLTIVDFGCGKSYLTFALYHLLAIKEKLPVRIIGLDLKEDVIETCSKLAKELNWDQLTFMVGDISDYEGHSSVDMVVTLHACDTATDAALIKAIGWGASVILSVPCCQHELFRQLSQPTLKPLLKHGILKERFSALVTDAIRANLLEIAGYRTQLLEFIDMEHTPKNILIRAVKGGKTDIAELEREYERFRDFLGVNPFMEREMK
ncbi:class I SAM-dependent methyltransferase [Cohnella cholangitidis]|uniref:SAM-dependent methyltransferase n=1 Tax=Cohnella cholangitidis TaxID=2598458 RepID=A0A7G5BVR1_9BACL|nr:SAM-dependent methyltransferase [Cohnella cholangitidis]QMV41045.1 SAM-dependent methyltransferase [Cohnella cholangitidis]